MRERLGIFPPVKLCTGYSSISATVGNSGQAAFEDEDPRAWTWKISYSSQWAQLVMVWASFKLGSVQPWTPSLPQPYISAFIHNSFRQPIKLLFISIVMIFLSAITC